MYLESVFSFGISRSLFGVGPSLVVIEMKEAKLISSPPPPLCFFFLNLVIQKGSLRGVYADVLCKFHISEFICLRTNK